MDSDVKVVESSFVPPRGPTPSKGLWLSPLDLDQVNSAHTRTFYLFRSNDAAAPGFFDVARLKEAMAKALVPFYPLAGRLGIDNDGRIEISCNSEGALFVVARADLTIIDDDVKDLKPSPELRRLFVPRVEPSSVILAVQVTFFECGGVALGAALHHAAIDALSAFHFFQTWSAFSRDGDRAAVELPCHDRTLLRARSPRTIHPDTSLVFYPKLGASDAPLSGPIAVASQAFVISKDQVASLKRLAGGASTFCAVSALVWRCACVARRLPPGSESRLTFAANIRRRLTPPLPDRYFGNAVVRLGVAGVVRDIASDQALPSVAGRIRGAIDRIGDEQLLRSAIDFYEMVEMDRQPRRSMVTLPETDLHITSWVGMPIYDADFGWGKPLVMSQAETPRAGFVHMLSNGLRNDTGNGGVRLFMCIEAANMKELERVLYEALARCE